MNNLQPFSGESSQRILEILERGNATPSIVHAKLSSAGFRLTIKTVCSRLHQMKVAGLVSVVGASGSYHSPVYALASDDQPEITQADRVNAPPAGIIPTRPLDPMAWIVVTSGVELEAA